MIKRYKNTTFGGIDFSDPKILERGQYHHRRIPIMVTITDAISSEIDLQKLLEAGMNVMRFAVSFNTRSDRIIVLDNLKKAAADCCQKFHVDSWPVSTCVELKTTMAKTGIFEGLQEIKLREGSYVILTRDKKYCEKCNAKRIFVENLPDDIKVGDIICIGNDETEIVCKDIINSKTLRCVVTEGGILKSLLNVCVKGYAPITAKLAPSDYKRIQCALDNEVDMIQINYVRDGQPFKMIKELIGKRDKRPAFITRICTQRDLEYIDDILKDTDAILLSREVLPLHLEKRFKNSFNNIQKWVAAKCQQAGKPVFLSGDVFVQALHTGDCGFVELADVSNAILDGFTGLVLTNCIDIESTLDVIYQLTSLCLDIEPYTATKSMFWNITEQVQEPLNAAEAAAMSCAAVANQALAKIIIVLTRTGRSVQALCRMWPSCDILAVCTSREVARRLHLYKSVIPIILNESDNIEDDEMKIQFAIELGLQMNWVSYGDTYVTLQRSSVGNSYCDMIRVTTVEVEKKVLIKCDDEEYVKNQPNSFLNMKRAQKKSKHALTFS